MIIMIIIIILLLFILWLRKFFNQLLLSDIGYAEPLSLALLSPFTSHCRSRSHLPINIHQKDFQSRQASDN